MGNIPTQAKKSFYLQNLMETLVIENTYEIEPHKPMPSKKHAYVQTHIIIEFAKKYEPDYVLFSGLTLRLPNSFQDYVPNLAVYEVGKLSMTEEEAQVTEVPLAVVEIASQGLEEMIAKINQYFALGVRSVWLVLPTFKNIYVYTAPQTYEVYRDTQILKDTVLNVEIDLSKVF
ncbi:MAG: Uma2 family endonuclease [Bacteroidetes bacterium]|nr:MAG: Uma2 family endonuclease [Bacteroidota bacterium]